MKTFLRTKLILSAVICQISMFSVNGIGTWCWAYQGDARIHDGDLENNLQHKSSISAATSRLQSSVAGGMSTRCLYYR